MEGFRDTKWTDFPMWVGDCFSSHRNICDINQVMIENCRIIY